MKDVYGNNPEYSRAVLAKIRAELENPLCRNKKANLLAFSSICHVVVTANPDDTHYLLESISKAIYDDDAKIRFAACESIYNILTICRTKMINEMCYLWEITIKVMLNLISSLQLMIMKK